MSREAFDPYYKWLGIPPKEQPPDHYRLLGINRFETDLDVIDHAADGRMALLRSFQSGPNAEASQKLLSKVAIARACLLNETSKLDYDAWLATTQPPPAPPLAQGREPEPDVPAIPFTINPPQRRPTRAPSSALPQTLKIIGGGILGILLGYLIVRGTMGVDMLQLFSCRVASERPLPGEPTTGEPVANEAPSLAESPKSTADPVSGAIGSAPTSVPANTANGPTKSPRNQTPSPDLQSQPPRIATRTPSSPLAPPSTPPPSTPDTPSLALELQPSAEKPPITPIPTQPAEVAALFQADGLRTTDGKPPEANTIASWKELAASALSKEFQIKGSLALRKIAERRERTPFTLKPEEMEQCRKAALELLTARPKKARDEATEVAIHQNCLLALKWVGDASCNDELLKRLTDDNPLIREAAMKALEVHADNSCVPRLKAALRRRGANAIDLPHDGLFMMKAGVQILGRISTPESREALTDLLASAKATAAKEEVRQAIDAIDTARKK